MKDLIIVFIFKVSYSVCTRIPKRTDRLFFFFLNSISNMKKKSKFFILQITVYGNGLFNFECVLMNIKLTKALLVQFCIEHHSLQ